MNRKTIYLIASVLTFLVFIGFLSETGPKEILGFSVNIWIFRAAWLVIFVSTFLNYLKLRKEG